MDKELKKKMNEIPLSLYSQKWVEKAADKGFEDFQSMLRQCFSKEAAMLESPTVKNVFAMLYYASFEVALNTFYGQVLDDHMTHIEFILDEIGKVTALMRKGE